jgi:hypothetical protein
MATATITQSPAQQVLDLRLKELELIEAKYTAASNVLETHLRDLESESRTITAIDKQYNEACVFAARGDAKADPASILAERDRRAHRIKGIEHLVAEAKEAVAALVPEYTRAHGTHSAQRPGFIWQTCRLRIQR